jgi:hypothetical protein
MNNIIKYFFIINVFLLGLSNLFGQVALNQGVYSIAGSAQYSSSTQNTDGYSFKNNIGNISPAFTYFIVSHFSIGANVSFNYNYNKGPEGDNPEQVEKITELTIGPVIRYYLDVKKVNPFIEASYNYSVENIGIGNMGNEYGNDYGLKAGLEIFLSGSVALEPSIGFIHFHYTMSSFNLYGNNNNFNVGIGASYFIF